jgi:hypothetical protein
LACNGPKFRFWWVKLPKPPKYKTPLDLLVWCPNIKPDLKPFISLQFIKSIKPPNINTPLGLALKIKLYLGGLIPSYRVVPPGPGLKSAQVEPLKMEEHRNGVNSKY